MTGHQEAYFSMANKTNGEMQKNISIWGANKIITATMAFIVGLFKSIEENLAIQNKTSIGLSKMKQKFRDKLNITTDVFLGIFRSYAKTIGDEDLYENSNLSMSDIKAILDNKIMTKVNTVKNYATKHLDDLKDYGMEQKMIEAYGKEADGYIEYNTTPQELVAEKKRATAQLKKLFKQLDEQLTEHLDNHMMQYKTKEPKFYEIYENARIIFDAPTISRSMMGKVLGEETGEPIENVLVTVVCENGKTFTYKTTEKGNFQFKKLPEGKCKVTFEYPYYDTLTVNSAIFDNAMTRLNVAIRKTE
jgi:predicted transcriptional regulator